MSEDRPERIVELIEAYPQFKSMYNDIYELCRNVEKVMNMFSKELQELDKNTVRYMMDEMQKTIDTQAVKMEKMKVDLEAERKENDKIKQEKDEMKAEFESRIQRLNEELAKMRKQNDINQVIQR